MPVFLVVVGLASVSYGILTVFGFTNNDISKDSELDKKLLSEGTRYFMGRYYSGIGLIGTGVGAIVLGLIFYLRP
jgi:hypothetical protein